MWRRAITADMLPWCGTICNLGGVQWMPYRPMLAAALLEPLHRVSTRRQALSRGRFARRKTLKIMGRDAMPHPFELIEDKTCMLCDPQAPQVTH